MFLKYEVFLKYMSSKVGDEEGVAGVGGGEEDCTAIGEVILVVILDLHFSGERWDNGVTIFIEADGETIFIGADVAMGDFTRLLGGSVAMEVFILVAVFSLDFSGERWDDGVTIFIGTDRVITFLGSDMAVGDFTSLLGGGLVAGYVFVADTDLMEVFMVDAEEMSDFQVMGVDLKDGLVGTDALMAVFSEGEGCTKVFTDFNVAETLGVDFTQDGMPAEVFTDVISGMEVSMEDFTKGFTVFLDFTMVCPALGGLEDWLKDMGLDLFMGCWESVEASTAAESFHILLFNLMLDRESFSADRIFFFNSDAPVLSISAFLFTNTLSSKTMSSYNST